jgi:hypothetical protein
MVRIVLLTTVAVVIAAMLVVTAGPTFARHASETGSIFGTCHKPGTFCIEVPHPSDHDEEEPPFEF